MYFKKSFLPALVIDIKIVKINTYFFKYIF